MSRRKRRVLLVLSGQLDQARLDQLRQRLELNRRGRLTDREDTNFGFRDVGPDGSPTLTIKLLRDADDLWAISVDTAANAGITDDEIARWGDEAVSAATAAGFQVIERREFPAEKRPSYETEWRNEDWLRTAGWDLPAQTLPELWPVLGLASTSPLGEKRAALTRFMSSPAWEAAPEGLRREAEEFLR